jgi:hypothetical protein
MQVTDLRTIEDHVGTVLADVVPKYVVRGADKWVRHDRAASTSMRTRRYMIEWSPGGVVPDGFFTTEACETSAVLSIVTDYAVPHQHVDAMIEADHHQLERALYEQLVRGATSDQLVSVASTGAPTVVTEEGDGDVMKIAHDYTIHYLRDWSA